MLHNFSDADQERRMDRIMRRLDILSEYADTAIAEAKSVGKAIIPRLLECVSQAKAVYFEGIPPAPFLSSWDNENPAYAEYRNIKKATAVWIVLRDFVNRDMLSWSQLKRLRTSIETMRNDHP